MTAKAEFLEKWTRVNAVAKSTKKSETMAKRSAAPVSVPQSAPAGGGGFPDAMRAPSAPPAPAEVTVELAPPPALVPFADMDFWYLSGTMTWTLPQGPTTINIPRGFVTDFASVPSSFWSWMPPVGRYGLPAIVHDWLYWDQTLPRSQADDIFQAALNDLNVSSFRKFILYRSVRWFGGKYWRENAAAKTAGEGRVLKLFPDDARITWADWRKKPGVFA